MASFSSSTGSYMYIALNVVFGALPLALVMRVRYTPKDLESMNFQCFRPWCIGCGYELKGLESALGIELWVGPAACPECGLKYPAVGE